MGDVRGLRLAPSVGVKEKRLATLIARSEGSPQALDDVVADAQILGSLELSGFPFAWPEVRRRDANSPPEVEGLRRALDALDARAPLTLLALREWHRHVVGGGELRVGEREPLGADVAPPAPAAFVASRLHLLEEWMSGQSGRELKPHESAALAMARIVEILPFDDGNGRVSRLAASHLMVRGGMRRPILVGGDRPRLEACLRAAFRLDTAPLAALLQEASERCLDVMIQALEGRA